MSVVTRFAPSPTGLLHVGNLRTALISWLYARSNSGKFILRVDDTDLTRSKEYYIESIRNDLRWIGINWDIYFKQSSRLKRYNQAKQNLIDIGRLYPCYETEEELAFQKRSLLVRGLPPIYNRASLYLKEEEKKKLELNGKKPHWRFLLHNEKICWNDRIKGVLKFEARNLSDPVLIRDNGTLTYSLASVVDDIDYKVTDIIRGEDHISNSAIHIQLFKALSAQVPCFSHISLLAINNKKLSKRKGHSTVQFLQEQGILPESAAIYLSKIGSSDRIAAQKNLEHLINEFSLSKLNQSTVQYSHNELKSFNSKILHLLEFKEIYSILKKLNIHNMDEDLWLAIRANIVSINDIRYWYKVCKETIQNKITNSKLIALSRNLIPNETFDSNTWDKWIKRIKEHTNLRGAKLFIPLRLAITGRENGPELKKLIPIIGAKLLLQRLDHTCF